MDSNKAITIENLNVSIGSDTIINDISLDVEKGKFVALLGPSGSGKTTLLRTIAGFVKPTSGGVNIFGENMSNVLPENRQVSMLFQEPVLFRHLSVKKNATVGFKDKTITHNYDLQRFIDAFEIREHLDKIISEGLSGGEKQRAALLRTFSHAKKILLLDEPLKSALNVDLRWQIMRAIKKFGREDGKTTICVTHDFEEASYLSDEIAVIVGKGTNLYMGDAVDMYYNPPTLPVARVLGNGTELDADFIFKKDLNESMCPFEFRNWRPRPIKGAQTLFIRPNNIILDPEGSGFKINDMKFLGQLWLVEIVPNVSGIKTNIEIVAYASTELIKKINSSKVVGAILLPDSIIAFDDDMERVRT